MKSANVHDGGKPSKQQHEARRPSASQTRLPSSAVPPVGAEVEQGSEASCVASAPREAPTAERRPPEPTHRDEPRTGVVRRMSVRPIEREPAATRRPSSRAESVRKRAEVPDESRSSASPADWRCLEWGQAPKERRPKRNSKVTIVQLSSGGNLVRQNGPAAWLPDAGDFVHRMSRLVAQGLGFDRCLSVCLRSSSAALSITEAGDAQVVAVSGPLASMTHVLRRAGLE